MGHKFQDQYRVPSARLQNWDYGWDASYFVTICTEGMQKFFGEIDEDKMILNEIGKIVNNEWLNSFEMRPDVNLQMGNYVIMPNHLHAIIVIGKNKFNTGGNNKEGDLNRCNADTEVRDAMHCVSTPQPNTNYRVNNGLNTIKKNEFGPQSKNLASIIRGFKSSVTKSARSIDPVFAWQSRFHDHIIRNEKSYHTISTYIKNNPKNWVDDKFYL